MIIENFEEEFDEAVEIRQELNNVLWKNYRNLAVVFDTLFDDKGGMLKRLSDLNYYKGGYPSETTPARIESVFKSIGKICKYYAALDKLDEINNILRDYGVQVEKTADVLTMNPQALNQNKKNIAKAVKAVKESYPDFEVKDDAAEMLEWFLDTTYKLQGQICARADEIKIDIYNKVTTINSEIDKSGFVTAVNKTAAKKTKMEQGKNVDTLIEKITEKADIMRANGDLLEEVILNKG